MATKEPSEDNVSPLKSGSLSCGQITMLWQGSGPDLERHGVGMGVGVGGSIECSLLDHSFSVLGWNVWLADRTAQNVTVNAIDSCLRAISCGARWLGLCKVYARTTRWHQWLSYVRFGKSESRVTSLMLHVRDETWPVHYLFIFNYLFTSLSDGCFSLISLGLHLLLSCRLWDASVLYHPIVEQRQTQTNTTEAR